MEINVVRGLFDLSGAPITGVTEGREQEPQSPINVGNILITALLCAPPTGTSYDTAEHIGRYNLALEIKNAQLMHRDDNLTDEATVEISASMAAKLQADIARIFAPIVAGQLLPMLNGR